MFDLLVLGGGPGGYLAAERAAQAGLTVALFEARALGGVCLNEGCVPSKTLLHSAKVLDYARHGEAYGVHVENAVLDAAFVQKRKNKVVKTLVAGVKSAMKAHGVQVVNAHATIMGKTAEGFAVGAGGETFTGLKLLIASGSTPVIPPIPGVKEGLETGLVVTNREILDFDKIPERLVIVGGGVIGLEMASYFNSAGSKVTVIEMLDHIAGPTEAEISSILLKNYKKKGVEFLLGCKVTGITAAEVAYEAADGETGSVPADAVLLSIGRRPVLEGFGLEALQVHTERGAIVTDQHMRTNVPTVYAVGDCNGKLMLAHTAYREAEVAVNHMAGKKDCMRYDAIPSVIYTNPEVTCVGETEESAKEKGIPVKVAKVSMRYSGRYLAETEGGDGICKLVVHEKENRVLGMHAIGSYASEFVVAACFMIDSQLPVERLKETVFPHPTVCEVLREALFAL